MDSKLTKTAYAVAYTRIPRARIMGAPSMRDDNVETPVTRRHVIVIGGVWAIALSLVPGLLIAVLLALFFPISFKAQWPLTIFVGMGISMLIVSKITQVDK